MDATYDLLVVNGIVATAADVGSYDIAIKDGKIALLAPTGSLAGLAAKKTIDALGGYVMVRIGPVLNNRPVRSDMEYSPAVSTPMSTSRNQRFLAGRERRLIHSSQVRGLPLSKMV